MMTGILAKKNLNRSLVRRFVLYGASCPTVAMFSRAAHSPSTGSWANELVIGFR